MGHESEVLLDIEQPLPVVRRSGSSKSGIWRMCGALLAVALCAAGAVCFTSNKSPDSQDEGSDLRHMLRAVPHANNMVKDAIHLTAGDVFKGSSLKWQDNMDQAFFQGGLKLVGNEIIIPNEGIYFIYSQVSFRVNCKWNPEEDQEIVHVSHEVMRSSDSYSDSDSKADSKPLFTALRSACVQVPDSEQSWYSTIYFGAAFRLYAGDRLFTVTTRPTGDVLKGSSMKWQDNMDQAFFQGGLKLVGNEIIIPNEGIYFIYSQVSFRVNCKWNPEEDQEIVHVSHEVMRSSDSYSDSDSKADSKPLFNALRSTVNATEKCYQTSGEVEASQRTCQRKSTLM